MNSTEHIQQRLKVINAIIIGASFLTALPAQRAIHAQTVEETIDEDTGKTNGMSFLTQKHQTLDGILQQSVDGETVPGFTSTSLSEAGYTENTLINSRTTVLNDIGEKTRITV